VSIDGLGRTLTAAAILLAGRGCAETGPNGVALLPHPAPDQVKPSDYEPERPLAVVAPGLSARLTFVATEGEYAIEVRDVLVAPGNPAVPLNLVGAAVVEVRDGAGVLTVGQTSHQVTTGATLAISDGDQVSAEARGTPLVLRAHLFKLR
jgi:hypothetical protein